MHYGLLVKIRADSSKDAMAEARDQVEDSTGDGKPFDYMSDDVSSITPTVLSTSGHKTYKELEKDWKSKTDANMKGHKAAIKDLIFRELAERYLSGKDALIYVNYKNQYGNVDESIKEIVEKACKSKTVKPKLPTGLDELAGVIAEMIRPETEHLSMLAYHLKQLDKLCDCKNYPNEHRMALYCYDCHFADLGGEGKKAYYFLFDRHA